MPAADKKGSRKLKKGTEKAPAPPPINITVQDCMVWPEPRAKGQGKGNANKPVYRSTLVRHLDDEEGRSKLTAPPPPLPPVRRDDGTAVEALRGWPGSRERAELDAQEYELAREAYMATVVTDPRLGKDAKKKTGKKDASKKEEMENVFIGDLIHQRYLNEHMEKRRREMEREQRKADAKNGRRLAFDKSVNIKANRTSQLRAIALAGKVETNPKDLWKMPRFTRGVKPHLSTGKGTTGIGVSDHFDGCDGGCHCEDDTANYVGDSDEEIQLGGDSPMAAI